MPGASNTIYCNVPFWQAAESVSETLFSPTKARYPRVRTFQCERANCFKCATPVFDRGFGRRFDELSRTAQTVGRRTNWWSSNGTLQWRHLYIYALVDLGRDKHKGNILRILQRNRFARATAEVYPIHTSPHRTDLRKPSTRGPRVCVNLTQFMAHPLCKVLKA